MIDLCAYVLGAFVLSLLGFGVSKLCRQETLMKVLGYLSTALLCVLYVLCLFALDVDYNAWQF